MSELVRGVKVHFSYTGGGVGGGKVVTVVDETVAIRLLKEITENSKERLARRTGGA